MSARRIIVLLVVAAVLGWAGWRDGLQAPEGPVPQTTATAGIPEITLAQLPPEAREVLALIRRDGPFPHARDGSVFGNREGLLPRQPRGYYAEYTVPTPGASDRGARRIVAGGQPRGTKDNYYTDDHYRSFRLIRE